MGLLNRNCRELKNSMNNKFLSNYPQSNTKSNSFIDEPKSNIKLKIKPNQQFDIFKILKKR